MRLCVHEAISEIPADAWNRLAGERIPFLQHEFLRAAEESGSVSVASGWRPRHLTVQAEDGSLAGALPLYEKNHSWGEFVFDWAWANAYHRAGLDYYPKLVAAVPFTPATCSKLLVRAADADAATQALLAGATELAGEQDCSSVHLLFPTAGELPRLEAAGYRLRKDCQFHWHNRAYADFDAFLGTFSSAKRKKARRDRRRVADAGIRFRRLSGHDLDAGLWQIVYDLLSRTFLARGSLPYFNASFFARIGAELPDNVLVVLAEHDQRPVAAALFYVGTDTLYGRYWGSNGDFDALHFETCYYQGIDYCIEHGLQHFEPGTQGEHKVSRGFIPEATWSAHWLARPEFHTAIGAYVAEEANHVERYMRAVDDHSPYRRD